jgi:MFS family permease
VQSVPPHETGSAMGFYQVVRYVGFSLGSALAAAILASHTTGSTGQPTLSGYTMVAWVAAVICVVAAVLAWVLPARGKPAPSVEEHLGEGEAHPREVAEGKDWTAVPSERDALRPRLRDGGSS